MHKTVLKVIIAALCLFAASAAAAQERFAEEEQLVFGQELFVDLNYRLAESVFKSAAIARPGTALAGDATFMEAEAQYNNGRYLQGLKSYIGIIEKYPATKDKYIKELYYRIAECYYQLKDPDNSIKYINLLLSSYKGSYLERDSYLLLGEDLLLTGQYDKAIDALNRLENYTDYAHFDYVYYLLGRTYYEKSIASQDGKKDAATAIKYFDRIKNEFPASGLVNHAQFRKANVYYGLGQYKKAVETAKKAIVPAQDKKFTMLVRYFIAWSQYMSAEYAKAMEGYDAIIAAGDNDILSVWSEYKKGMCLEALARDAEALAAYRNVIEKHGSTIPAAYASYAEALYYYKQKQYYEAMPRFEKFVSLYDAEELNLAAYFMIAEINTALNELAKAADVYSRIEEKYQAEALRARFLRAWCYFREGDYKRAMDTYALIESDASAPADLKGRSLLKSGDCYYELENFSEAAAKYDAVVKDYESVPDAAAEAHYGKGWIAYRTNDYKNALLFFAKAKKQADTPDVKLRADFMTANSLYSSHDFEKALALYSGIMQNPASAAGMRLDSLFYSGWCRYRLEQFDAAIELWEKFEASTGDSVKKAEAIYRIGWAYFRKSDFDTSAQKFAVILDKYKSTHLYQEALLKSGDSYYNKKDYNRAIEFYKEIVDKFPLHYRVGEALYGIQWSYYQLGQDEKAIELSKQFLEKYPESSFTPEIQYRVAEHYYNTGKFETAVSEFTRFLEKYGKHELADNACYWLGISNFNLKKYNEAISAFRELSEKFPENNFNDKALFKTASAYYKLREFEKAAEYFTQFTDKYKNNQLSDDAYFNLAMTYKRLDKNEDSKNWYVRLVAEFPDSELVERSQMNLGYLLQDTKQYDEAITWFKKAAAMKGKKAVEASFWVGDCLAAKKEYDAAAKAYLDVYENYRTDELWAVSALDAAGKIYEKQNKLKSAISAYEKIMNVTKNPKYTDTAKKKIELLKEQYKIMNPEGPVKGGAK